MRMSEQFPECKMTSSRASFTENSFEKSLEMNEFPNNPLKRNFIPAFDKISLAFQTVLELEARRLLLTFQLDVSWTLKMSDRQTKWSVRKAIWQSEEFREYHLS